MTAKEYLKQALQLKQAIDCKQNQILELQAMAERTTSVYEALRVSGAPNRKTENATINLEAIYGKITGNIGCH